MPALAQQTGLTAAEAFLEIEARGIALCRGLNLWVASVEIVRTRRRAGRDHMEIVSAMGRTSLDAVEALVEKLDNDLECSHL